MMGRPWQAVARYLQRGVAHREGTRRTRAWTGAASETQPLLDEPTLRQLMRLRIETGRSFMDWLGGEHAGRRKVHALDFEDYRGYSAGDDLRLIDWNAYARLGELFVKTSVAEEAQAVALLIDCSCSMDWGRPSKLRYVKQLAALLGALALVHGDRVRIVGIGDGAAYPGAPLYGLADLAALSTELETLPILPQTGLAASITAYEQVAEPYGGVVIFSDLLVPMSDITGLDRLQRPGRDVYVVQVVDPLEAAPDLHGVVELRDRETGMTAVRRMTPAVRRQYTQRFHERTDAIAARLAVAQIRHIQASTAIAPLDIIADGMLSTETIRGV